MLHSKKHAVIIIAVTVAAITSLLFIPVGDKRAFSDRDGKRNTIVMMSALNDVIKNSERNFYKEVDREEMYEGAIKGALAALDDPYSFYLTPRNLKREAENLYHGEFGGLGIQIYEDKGFIKISRPLRDSPALRIGAGTSAASSPSRRWVRRGSGSTAHGPHRTACSSGSASRSRRRRARFPTLIGHLHASPGP